MARIGAVTRLWLTGPAAVAVAIGCLGVVPADAQQPDEEEAAQPSYFNLNQLDAYFEVRSEYYQTRVRYDDRGRYRSDIRQTNRDSITEERLGLIFSGDVVDPGFISFFGDFSFGLTQNHYHEDGFTRNQSDRESGYLVNFDARVNFLQGQPVSGAVYGLRTEDRIARRFQPTLRERRTGFGSSWALVDDVFPMELSYDYLETDRTGNTRDRDDEHFTDSILRYGLEWRISEHHRFKMSYEHANSKQEFQGLSRPFETDRNLWIFDHIVEFGDAFQHDLHTLVRWQEESGDFARDIFEYSPVLTLRHSDNFQTSYRYQLDREEYEQLRVTQHRGEFQFIHQLYSNLTTTGQAFGLWEKTDDDVETTQYGATMDWQYNRRNPLGHLYSNLALAFDNEHVRGDNGRRVVLNESATFVDPIAVTLRNRDVARGTIVVTDATNRRRYRLGLDYSVYTQGEWTRLVRNQAGQIANGETVLVDYEFNTPADGQINTVRVDFNIEQRFRSGLTPYYLFGYRHQDVDDSTGFQAKADRTDHHRMGVRLDKPRYNLSAEFEIFDDSIEPYDAFHLQGRYTVLQNTESQVEGAARFSRYFFEGGLDDRNVSILDLELDHRWYISESLSSTQRAAYRFQDDSIGGETNAVDLSAVLTYAVGELLVELNVEYDLLDLPASKEDGFGVWLSVRRDVPNLFARR